MLLDLSLLQVHLSREGLGQYIHDRHRHTRLGRKVVGNHERNGAAVLAHDIRLVGAADTAAEPVSNMIRSICLDGKSVTYGRSVPASMVPWG